MAGGPFDPELLVLRVDDAAGAPLAIVYSYGCHPTALGHENLAYSADWPWAAGAALAARCPARYRSSCSARTPTSTRARAASRISP